MAQKVIPEYVPSPEVSGKKLVPALAIGCLLFALFMGFGTWGFAKLTTPYFIKMEKDREAAKGKAAMLPLPAGAPIKK